MFLVITSVKAQGFITTWRTTSANESIIIPTTGSGYNYTVDWGSGRFSLVGQDAKYISNHIVNDFENTPIETPLTKK